MTQLEKEQVDSGLVFGLDRIFKKMANIVQSKNEISIENPKVLERKKQEEQASKFIDAKLYDLYFSMVASGYQPNEKQNTLIKEYISTSIKYGYTSSSNERSTPKLGFLEKHLEKGYVFTNESAYQLLSHWVLQPYLSKELLSIAKSNLSTISENSNFESNYLLIIENLTKIMHTESFSKYAAKEWLNAFHVNDEHNKKNPSYQLQPFSHESIDNIILFLNEFPHIILPYIPLSDFVDFVTEWNIKKKDINSDKRHDIDSVLSKTLETYYKEDIQSILDTTKEVYIDSYLQQKTIEQTQILAKNYHISELPKQTQEIIQNIQKEFTILRSEKQSLTEDQLFTIDNLFEKKIPDILQKYFSITPEYRTTLTNLEGKNALQLMEESLINYQVKLKDIVQSVNERKITELSAIKRYSKSI